MDTNHSKNDDSANGNTQITFKLTLKEKQHIEEEASKCNVSVSELCREKSLSDEISTFIAKTRIAELEKQNTSFRVKLSYYRNSQRDPNSIVLQLSSSKQKEIFEKMFTDFPRGKQSVGGNIVTFTLDNLMQYDDDMLKKEKNISFKEIKDAFYPEDDEEEEDDDIQTE